MKKGIVMEKHRQYTVVMTNDGLFLKVKPVGDAAGVGAEISFKPPKKQRKSFFFFFIPAKR